MRPTDLQLDLETYAGPFDLLCTMLLRRELPVGDVALAEIVVGYVQRLAVEERVDPNTASEFLLLLAALMEVKVRELLTIEADLELTEPMSAEAHEELLERLIQYSTFKRVAAWMGDSAADRWWRVASMPVVTKRREYDGPVLDPALLKRSMDVLLAAPDVDVRHLVGKHASVHDMTSQLLKALRERRTFTLDEAVRGMSRLDQAVAFVAALELCKNGHVELRQDELFGPIHVEERAEPATGATPAQADEPAVLTGSGVSA